MTACRCGQPVHDGTFLCRTCVRTLDVALVQVAAHHADLETLRTRRTRYGTGAGRGSVGKTRPIGVDLRFVTPSNATYASPHGVQVPGREGQGSALDDDVRNTLTGWARVCLEHWPSLTTPADSVPAVCVFLGSMATAVAGQPWADELLRDSIRLEKQLARLVDRPPDRWYAGKCSHPREAGACTAELYADADSGYVDCPACHYRHDVAERRDFLLKEARLVLVTATEAAGALLAWTDYDGSETKLVDLIRKWRDRGRVARAGQVGQFGRDRDLYRLGDIQDLLVGHAQDQQEHRIAPTG